MLILPCSYCSAILPRVVANMCQLQLKGMVYHLPLRASSPTQQNGVQSLCPPPSRNRAVLRIPYVIRHFPCWNCYTNIVPDSQRVRTSTSVSPTHSCFCVRSSRFQHADGRFFQRLCSTLSRLDEAPSRAIRSRVRGYQVCYDRWLITGHRQGMDLRLPRLTVIGSQSGQY